MVTGGTRLLARLSQQPELAQSMEVLHLARYVESGKAERGSLSVSKLLSLAQRIYQNPLQSERGVLSLQPRTKWFAVDRRDAYNASLALGKEYSNRNLEEVRLPKDLDPRKLLKAVGRESRSNDPMRASLCEAFASDISVDAELLETIGFQLESTNQDSSIWLKPEWLQHGEKQGCLVLRKESETKLLYFLPDSEWTSEALNKTGLNSHDQLLRKEAQWVFEFQPDSDILFQKAGKEQNLVDSRNPNRALLMASIISQAWDEVATSRIDRTKSYTPYSYQPEVSDSYSFPVTRFNEEQFETISKIVRSDPPEQVSLWAGFGLENPDFLTYSLGQIAELETGHDDPSPRLARKALKATKSLEHWHEKSERLLVTARVLELLSGGKTTPDSLSTAAQSILALDARKKSKLPLDELGREDISSFLYRSELQPISILVVNQDSRRALLELSALGPDQPWSNQSQEVSSESPARPYQTVGTSLRIYRSRDTTLNEMIGDVCGRIETEKATRFVVYGQSEENSIDRFMEIASEKASHRRGPHDLWQRKLQLNEDFFTKNGLFRTSLRGSSDPLDMKLYGSRDLNSKGLLLLPGSDGGFDLLFLDDLEQVQPILEEFEEFSGGLKAENRACYTKALKSLAESYISQDAKGIVEYGYRESDETCKATPEASDILLRSVLHIKLQELNP